MNDYKCLGKNNKMKDFSIGVTRKSDCHWLGGALSYFIFSG